MKTRKVNKAIRKWEGGRGLTHASLVDSSGRYCAVGCLVRELTDLGILQDMPRYNIPCVKDLHALEEHFDLGTDDVFDLMDLNDMAGGDISDDVRDHYEEVCAVLPPSTVKLITDLRKAK